MEIWTQIWDRLKLPLRQAGESWQNSGKIVSMEMQAALKQLWPAL
jgi:hypothetical protein